MFHFLFVGEVQCSNVQVENAQLKSEYVAATDKIQKLQNEIHRIEAEKRDNLNKIQNMHTEMKKSEKRPLSSGRMKPCRYFNNGNGQCHNQTASFDVFFFFQTITYPNATTQLKKYVSILGGSRTQVIRQSIALSLLLGKILKNVS